jgi:hypothetical protein
VAARGYEGIVLSAIARPQADDEIANLSRKAG